MIGGRVAKEVLVNSFELHEKADGLTATMSSYRLARELLEYQERYNGLLADYVAQFDAAIEDAREIENLKNELAEYQRIYGTLDQSDYLTR